MADGRNISDQPIRNNMKTQEILEKLLLVKDMINTLFFYNIILISKKITS